MSRTINTITIRELIDILQDYSHDYGEGTKVAFSSDYGDHCHTQQVLTIEGNVNEEQIYESAYSDSGFAVEKEPDEEDGEKQRVLIIS